MENDADRLALEQDLTSEQVNGDSSIEKTPNSTTQLKVTSIEQRIGQLLALGANTPEIVQSLQEEKHVETQEEALTILHAVYTSWREIEDESQLELADLKNWHIMMRHELLKKTMDNNPRAALAVLESLADLQKIQVALDADIDKIPIQINLVPVAPPAEQTDEKNTNIPVKG